MTTKGQVTIPIEIRQVLELEPQDKVLFELDGQTVRVRRADSIVQRTAGIFKSKGRPLSAERLREAAEKAFADETEQRSGR